ncbi:bifunctional isocitrate dehydrogenase kinase/phosphatase [Cecembia rubra]|uniref:bifunctional isocitrate dehydrogenase kinase/phosphatase n=1 Tax=Cecembia rubra TaxID=1485585 RepID=UPI002714F096|nr:bifunctional isocitrate dehydrogenase kinase/phosphatase [Cecembia rubra]
MNKPCTFYIHLFVVLMFWSCASDRSSQESVSDIQNGEILEEQILVENGLQQIKQWSDYWKEKSPTFNPAAFTLERKETFEELEWPEENPIVSGNPFYPYLLPNPEGKGVVDIYSYKVFVPAEGKPGFQPDSEVIFFKENGMRERLLFIGPSGGFEEAVWVSPDKLLVAGYCEEEEGVSPK